MRDAVEQECQRRQAQSMEELRALHQMCREGRLYDVERWIGDGKPLQLAPETILKGSRPKTALQIALESGQHSRVALLLKSGYRLDLERYAPLDLALEARRWDLFDLLLAHGAYLKDADVYTVLNSCLQLYCDLHNDGATGDQVGRYEIEHIDCDALVEEGRRHQRSRSARSPTARLPSPAVSPPTLHAGPRWSRRRS